MGERPRFHPDLRGLAPVLPRALAGPRLLRLTRRVEPMLASRDRPTSSVDVESVGDVSVRVHRPLPSARRPYPALLWVHGGGYVLGAPWQDDEQCRQFARRLGMLVVAVDYRKAPEHPYPIPLEDCYTALTWLAQRPDIDPDRIAIGGASAGGGLAAALAQLATDRGEVDVAFQLLSYPMLDDRTVLRTDIDERGFRLWNCASNHFGWQCYLGREPGTSIAGEHAVPARREDLSGLPPAWIGVGTLDLFHDEDLAYAERLREAGVPCHVDVIPGAFHAFDVIRPTARVSLEYWAAQVGALAEGLRPVSS